MRILILEDDHDLRTRIAAIFKSEGFVVDEAADGEDGEFALSENPIDLAIVDLGLPEKSGMELIRSARRNGKTFPILILTARDRWQDKVEGLEAGADDYVVKPFEPNELMARVRALLRRSYGQASAELSCGAIRVFPSAKRVEMSGREVVLTAYEFRLLEYLVLHQDKVVSKTKLMEHLYPDDEDHDSNVIEVFIRRLRRKLNLEDQIQTLRGQGYILRSRV